MTKRTDSELSSIHQRINSIPMAESQRQAALAAMRHALIIVDGCVWLVHKIGQVRTALSSTRAWGTKAHG